MTNLVRNLRHHSPDAEAILWLRLKNGQVEGVKFRRQQPIGKYIVDFVCFERKLIVEVDGGQHNTTEGIKKDSARTAWLENEGFHVVRFWSDETITNTEGVVWKIQEFLGQTE